MSKSPQSMTDSTYTDKNLPGLPLADAVIAGIQERKGKKITLIDLAPLAVSSTGQFIICQGTSTQQVGAIADSIRETVRNLTGRKPYNYDGYRNCEWIVIDYGDTMVHVFLPEVRERYRLEELWSDAPVTEIPDLD